MPTLENKQPYFFVVRGHAGNVVSVITLRGWRNNKLPSTSRSSWVENLSRGEAVAQLNGLELDEDCNSMPLDIVILRFGWAGAVEIVLFRRPFQEMPEAEDDDFRR